MVIAYTGDKGEPEWVPSGASPTFAADGTEAAAWFQKGRTFRRTTTQAALSSATGMEDLDLAMVDAIPGAWFKYDGTAGLWVMYGVAVFANATARDAAITTPAAGMRSYLTGVGRDYRYSGSSWACVTPISCVLQKSANQSMGSAAALTWDVEVSDPAGMHDNSSNTSRISAVEAGLYLVAVTGFFSNTSLGSLYGRKNGSADVTGSLNRAAGNNSVQSVFSVLLAAGDYVEIMGVLGTAGTITGGSSLGQATVTVTKVG